jgi:hypothetical protein
MDTGEWPSKVWQNPHDAVPTPARKVAILKLPRGYDATKLFRPEIHRNIQAFEAALRRRDMRLGLSSPDIVGIRLPEVLAPPLDRFLHPLTNLGAPQLEALYGAHQILEGTLDGRNFLFAIAIKRTIRSDRQYQPLFEANVLKYLIEEILRGAAFRFYVHLGSLEGADVRETYRAASLVSLLRGGEPRLAIDSLLHTVKPREVAQVILNDLPVFPI